MSQTGDGSSVLHCCRAKVSVEDSGWRDADVACVHSRVFFSDDVVSEVENWACEGVEVVIKVDGTFCVILYVLAAVLMLRSRNTIAGK
mmetsp:Transcript_34176/g.88233  ORF Transcript_34176/g.88233 Transcript_34176/m.88233 type:complete len:88 (+) Transcript_34176:931-1194(+)